MNGEKKVRTITYREAVKEAIREALQRDARVFLMGEDVGHYGGCYAVSKGLLDEFGPERIRDTPLCESGFVGAGIGAALGGMRPIVEVMTVNFSLLALDQIVNTAATLLHMSGGQCNVPLVIRMATGAGKQLAAQHAHSFEGWFAHIPGLRVLAPATVEDARGMLWTALADPDPVLICENNTLYNMEGELAADAGPVDIDTARVRRPGSDLTLVTYSASLYKCLEAAGVLALEGIDCEVIDLRTLRPLDDAVPYLESSVARTHRVLMSTRVGAAAACPPRSRPASWSGPSTSWTCRWNGCAPRRCPSPTPDTWNRRPCRAWTALSRQHGGWCTMGEFRMPSLGADMETGKLVEWLVVPGQRVRRGDIVAMVETQKGYSRWRSSDGVMGELLVQPGQTVPVGTLLATIDNGTAGAGRAVRPRRRPGPARNRSRRPQRRPQRRSQRNPHPEPAAGHRIASSPSARQLAHELGIDLATVTGTGPHGPSAGATWRLRPGAAAGELPAPDEPVAPVSAPSPPAEPAPADRHPHTRAQRGRGTAMRKAIAAAVSRSNREIPHYYLETEIDLGKPCSGSRRRTASAACASASCRWPSWSRRRPWPCARCPS